MWCRESHACYLLQNKKENKAAGCWEWMSVDTEKLLFCHVKNVFGIMWIISWLETSFGNVLAQQIRFSNVSCWSLQTQQKLTWTETTLRWELVHPTNLLMQYGCRICMLFPCAGRSEANNYPVSFTGQQAVDLKSPLGCTPEWSLNSSVELSLSRCLGLKHLWWWLLSFTEWLPKWSSSAYFPPLFRGCLGPTSLSEI